MDTLFLSQQEINDICAPLTRASSQVKYLQGLGLKVMKKRNGAPLVLKRELERAFSNYHHPMAENKISTEPNKKAFLARIKRNPG